MKSQKGVKVAKQGTEWHVSTQPLSETVLAAALVGVHWGLGPSWSQIWDQIDPDAAQSIFQTGAGVVAIIAALAAFGITSGGDGPRAEAMRRVFGKELRRNWRALLITSAIAPFLAVAAQILSAAGYDWGAYLFEFALLWTSLRLVRLTWLVDRLQRQDMNDEVTPPQIGRKDLTPEFRKRMGA